jgi:hypothetical protein
MSYLWSLLLKIIAYSVILGINLTDYIFEGRSTYMCIIWLALHKLWTKFWNETLLKIILFSFTSSLSFTCTHKYEIILFHNTLTINFSIAYILLSCLCLISFFPIYLNHVYLLPIFYHTQFLCQNQVFIVCMTQDQLFHIYDQKCSQIFKCHK